MSILTDSIHAWTKDVPEYRVADLEEHEKKALAARKSGLSFYSISLPCNETQLDQILSIICARGWEFRTMTSINSGHTLKVLFTKN